MPPWWACSARKAARTHCPAFPVSQAGAPATRSRNCQQHRTARSPAGSSGKSAPGEIPAPPAKAPRQSGSGLGYPTRGPKSRPGRRERNTSRLCPSQFANKMHGEKRRRARRDITEPLVIAARIFLREITSSANDEKRHVHFKANLPDGASFHLDQVRADLVPDIGQLGLRHAEHIARADNAGTNRRHVGFSVGGHIARRKSLCRCDRT